MPNARIVEFYELSATRSVLDEIESDLTKVQMVRFERNVNRLETHGWGLDGSFFDNVAGSKMGLREYRLTLDKVEYRVLFSEEAGGIFLMLVGYKEQSGGIPASKISTAENRLRVWRAAHPAKPLEKTAPDKKRKR
jgi:hypothetical protein